MELIEIDGKTFQIGKLDVLAQLHVSRRVLPLLKPMAEAWKTSETANLLDIVMAVSEDFSTLPDETLNYVIFKCMAVVRLQQGERFAPIVRNDKIMFEDIDMVTLMRLTIAVIMDNFQSFFVNLPGVASSAGE
jgi:hypothetical protein